jgi:hypothetical protein
MPVMPTLRYADPRSASRYPLPVAAALTWTWRDGAWHTSVKLPAIGPGMLLVPSLALLPSATPTSSNHDASASHPGPRHQWQLQAVGGAWKLQAVPASVAVGSTPAGSPVTSHIDCFRIHRRLQEPLLSLRVEAERPPEQYLACVSCRPFTMAAVPQPGRRAALAVPPPARSQQDAPAEIAQRICSPTCVSMVLELLQRPHDWLALAQACHDPVSGMYGVWPLALRAAAEFGSLGAVEVFSDWTEPLQVLDHGLPLVASIRFGPGELPGAPLDETSGHLVVVHSAGPDDIGVCDPAAPTDQVQRRYDTKAFCAAWLRQRGAAYILSP